MEYKLLSHLYYENKEEYEQLYKNRIQGDNCVNLNFDIKGNTAFYCITTELHKEYIQILELSKQINDKIRVLPALALRQFAQRSLIEEIVLTNNIEGVYSTRREIDGVLKNLQNCDKKKRFFGLVNKYNMMSKEEIVLNSSEDVRKIYDELVLNEVVQDDPDNIPDGEIFRKEMSEVTSVTGKVIHKGLASEAEIISAMDKALRILNGDEPAIERIAIFHYLFGYIHPFYDGNGRTSRFISSYYLSRALGNNLIGYRLSYTIKENIGDYYKAFKICNEQKNRGDITPFVIAFMKIVHKSLLNLKSALDDRILKLHAYTKKMRLIECFSDETMQKFCYVLIQAELFSEHGITKKELAETTNISPSTVDKRLSIVSDAGFLKAEKIGHALYFNFDIDRL